MNLKESNKKGKYVIGICSFIVLLCILNILFVMITKTHLYTGINIIEYNEAKYANGGVNILYGKRGTIYDSAGEAIAQDVTRYTMYACLDETKVQKINGEDGKVQDKYLYVRDYEATANALASIIDMDANEILTILNNAKNQGLKQTEFGLKGKNLARSVKDEIDALNLEGIGFFVSVERNYPTNIFASHLIGYANYDEQVLVEDEVLIIKNTKELVRDEPKEIKDFANTLAKCIANNRISLSNALRSTGSGKSENVLTLANAIVDEFDLNQYESRIKGKMGLEYTLDSILKGQNGREVYVKDKSGYALPNSTTVEKYERDGNDVYLTIDRNVQLALQSALDQTSEETKASRAWGIVMECESGEILGWASSPSFDLNKRDIEDYLNVPSQYLYEPGSVMKAFTYAAAIDSGVYPYEGTFDSGVFYFGEDEDGKIYRSPTPVAGNNPIRDALNKNYGTISYDKGFIVSSNIGICELLTNHLDYQIFKEYIVDGFQFTKPVDIPYVTNYGGSMQSTYAVEKLNTGFGQGISVNALQICQAYTAIFNDGKMVRPYVVDRIVNSETNEVIEQYETEVVGQPISEKTAHYMVNLMQQVVEDDMGTAHYRYKMDDVNIIAKTGTGQIANEHGQYGDVYTMSVMAAAPAEDPKVMVYYVFEANDYLNYSGEPFKETMKAALVARNITSNQYTIEEEGNDKVYQQYTMPSLVNHSMDYVERKLNGYECELVIVGDGDVIVDQYPLANEDVLSNQKIFLKTNGSQITMPNMYGWTKKEVSLFWEMSDISVVFDGNGRVVSQNISPGQLINKKDEIMIKME